MKTLISCVHNDFDGIASVSKNNRWNHNNHYHKYLMKQLPNNSTAALDIGCGTGEFSRLLSLKCTEVTGVDLSTGMINMAQQLSANIKNITFLKQDISNIGFADVSFDLIVSIAALHHVAYEDIIKNCKRWLRKNGVLAILDIYKCESILDHAYSAVACPVNSIFNLLKNRKSFESIEEKRLMREHILHDKYMTFSEIKSVANRLLPNASVKRHLFWRYSLIWHKEGK